MRYVFAALMVLILLRGWRISAVDSRRSTRLRRLNPETGLIGELIVADGDGRMRIGQSFPVILEGTIGSARRADIRLKHSSVLPIHADYQMTEEGLKLQARPDARLRDAVGRRVKALTLHDGDYFIIGTLRLLLVLSDADSAPVELERDVPRRRPRREADGEDIDELFMANPVGRYVLRDGDDEDDPYDEDTDADDLFETDGDDYDDDEEFF